MLIEFRVKNFRSIRKEQVLSLVKSTGEDLESTNWFQAPDPNNISLLNSVVIYGANASGKSNIILALKAMERIVINSARKTQRGDELPVTPFLFSSKTAKAPTEFEASFIKNNIRYQYGFTASKEIIFNEWLIAYPKGRPQKWFTRTYQKKSKEYKWELGSSFTGKKQYLVDATRPNALFLSTAIQLNNKQLQPIYDWFRYTSRISSTGGWGPSFTASECEENKKTKEEVLRFLKAADLGISDISIKAEKFDPTLLDSNLPQVMIDEMIEEFKDKEIFEIKSTHKTAEGKNIQLNFKEESDGTKKVFAFAGPLLDSLKNGYVMIIDELHDNLHPKIVEYLVKLFHNPRTNPNNAQLIFTTHETSILNQEIFRRDQIWFCEKNEEQSTDLFPLTDFSPRKGRDNLELAYLAGRYGAIPFIGRFDYVGSNSGR
ncbi:MAG: ATP-binding protein [Chlorobi bacterium]|nr:ATP-binding protein [Chlorobiota bacterium]